MTFEQIEARLIEAMATWWRMPDREAGWQHVRALWPDIKRHGLWVDVDGEHDQRDAMVELPKRPAPTRDQIAAMIEASDWLGHAGERDRRLVAIVLAAKASGAKRVPWEAIWLRLGRGKPGPEGLRKRYSRAITAIANGVNG